MKTLYLIGGTMGVCKTTFLTTENRLAKQRFSGR